MFLIYVDCSGLNISCIPLGPLLNLKKACGADCTSMTCAVFSYQPEVKCVN